MNGYLSKRFVAFMLALAATFVGFLFGRIEIFPVYATAVGALFTAYVTGQTWTDNKEASAEVKLAGIK